MEPLALHDLHQRLGATFGEVFGREVVSRYAPLAAEHAKARSSAVVADLSFREWLHLTGEDRASFLHGMVTNEVNKLPEGRATYAALLTPKGAMVADVRILKRPTELWLDTEPGHAEKVRAFLERYLISEDAELVPATAQHRLLTVLGPSTHEVLRAVLGDFALPGHDESVEREAFGATALGNTLLDAHGVDLLVPPESAERLFEALRSAGATPVGFEALEALRVEAGVPRYGQDMEDTTIPLEANLQRGIDYHKGCYIGQEVIARATFRGHMNRKLAGLVLGTELPPPRAELRRGDRKVGWLTSAVQVPGRAEVIALGYVHRDSLEPGTKLEVAGYAHGATVQALPFTAR